MSGRYLSFAEREEIALLRAQGCTVQEVARQIGRAASTISRELRRNAAVTTKERSEVLPNIPTVGEFVPGYEASSVFGLGAPKNVPGEIIGMLKGTSKNSCFSRPVRV